MRGAALAAALALGAPFLAAGPAAAQAPAAQAPRPPRIQTVELTGPRGRVYRISIARPDAPAPAAGYPVIYVLDANALFPTVADSARIQAFRPSWTGIGPAVVVGVGVPGDALFDLPGRYYDLTTPVRGGGASPGGGPAMPSGGADDFLAFIDKQVKPAVEGSIPVDRRRQALLGHSLGGLFVLHTLFTRPESFQAYVAISPSVWWGGGGLYGEAERFAARPGPVDAKVLLTVGEYEQTLSPAARAASGAVEQQAALDRLKMVDGVTRMADLLRKSPGLGVRCKVLAGEDHASGAAVAASLGVRFVLLPLDQFEPPR